MDDLNYDELDPGIVEVVRYLRQRGYDTTDSGDGLTKYQRGIAEEGDPCYMPVPHVVCLLTPNHRHLIASAGLLRVLLVGQFGEGWNVQASYDTKDGKTLLFAYQGELT